MLNVAIAGATGYTGAELARILLSHPEVKITALTSESSAGKRYSQIFPAFAGKLDLELIKLNADALAGLADLVFLCLPHHESMETAKAIRKKGKAVIDLSADLRLGKAEVYEEWYGPHTAQDLLKEAVYGLPELHREKIKTAKLVANPGCYPTSCILGLAPLLKRQLIDLKTIHCDSKSGVSGAGRKAELAYLFCEVSSGFKAYKVGNHRHTPEIEQELSGLAGTEVKVSFTPHLLPIDRGILSTLYAQANGPLDTAQLQKVYAEFYAKEPFVRIRKAGEFPDIHDVRFSNYCDIGVHYDARTSRVIIVSVIDNLVKGASGQAVQNMNLMFGFPETKGLEQIAPVA